MTTIEYGFVFPDRRGSNPEGPNDPTQKLFTNLNPIAALVREALQNSTDNPGKHADGPIRVVFELEAMSTKDIPDVGGLSEHVEAVVKQTTELMGHKKMVTASNFLKKQTLPVLRYSDYHTTGLQGNENEDYSQITRATLGGTGISLDDGRGSGGAGGVGSIVGISASDVCTVLYSSIPEDTHESVFTGYARYASHTLNGAKFQAGGSFKKLNNKNTEYLRPAPKIGPFSERTEPGTDMFILGYRWAQEDPELKDLRDHIIDNFMVKIAKGHLVVEGIAYGKKHWVLDADTLPGYTRKSQKAHAFYQALQDPDPVEKIIKNVGMVRLYINMDDSLDAKLHTITMRAPLMKIDTFKHNVITAKYAAILICDSPEGNKYLRQLEPPAHDKWDVEDGPADGKKVIKDLKRFVRDALTKKVTAEVGEKVEIKGLPRFLPMTSVTAGTGGKPSGDVPKHDETGPETESSTVSGMPIQQKPTVTTTIIRPPIAGVYEKFGDEKKPKEKGEVTEDKESSLIQKQDISFRSWSSSNQCNDSSITALAITADKTKTGDLKLVALGPEGKPEKSFSLSISRAVLHCSEQLVDIEFSGNILKNLTLKGGQRTRIDIYMPAGERYRLGVA
ncbi:hypothetical protein [Spongorhabdus nitratireducens]